MPKIALAMILVVVLVLSGVACSSSGQTTSPSTTLKSSAAAAPSITTATPAVATILPRPAGGKAQELTFKLTSPATVYKMSIHLSNGETLDLDWKFVGVNPPQAGIRFLVSPQDGRELDAKLQPVNAPGRPFFDPNQPTLKLEEMVGSHLEIKVGQDKYCDEGYYTLMYTASQGQSGTIYLNYMVVPAGK